MSEDKRLPKNKDLSKKKTRKMRKLFAGKGMILSERMSEEYKKYNCNCK